MLSFSGDTIYSLKMGLKELGTTNIDHIGCIGRILEVQKSVKP